ncbi:hypothetical protein B1C81_29850 [Streptomyces sp. HG99]|nr:hypothetical protein B1C81_29850 [Streptomyces sp. HG99]
MSADEISPAGQWPLPPAWMFTCTDCVRLYPTMKEIRAIADEFWLAGERGVDWDPFDSAVGAQIRLARHLASARRDSCRTGIRPARGARRARTAWPNAAGRTCGS